MNKISIRFFNDQEVRAVWDEQKNKWLFSVIDIVEVLSDSNNPRRYWSDLKIKLGRADSQLYGKIVQLKLKASDGKFYSTDCLDADGIKELGKQFPGKRANRFIDWFTYSPETIDAKSKQKAYALFESDLLSSLEPGSIKCLQQIHAYLFGGLYDFAGQIRKLNISKGGFMFASANFLVGSLRVIERMPETTFDEILDKYIEMNIAHPFMEGNGRSTRIWLDLIFKRSLKKCVDWSKIGKSDYHLAMRESPTNPERIKALIKQALTDKINDREMFMKGIDYSYYYEEEDIVIT